ncbi:MAG: DNA (cytosine-5-)-methyltransferase [Planctomycetota bacterium]
MKRRVVEFFAGIGLVRLGLGPDYEVSYANDNDDKKRTMYIDAFGKSGDDEAWDGRSIHKIAGAEIPKAELWTASFPCNDLSIAGAWRGIKAGPESSAFFAVTRLLRESRELPRVLLFENVLGFLMRDAGADLRHALQDLNDLGYAVDVFTLDAAWWTPQSRKRLFIVGTLGEGASSFWSSTPSRIRPSAITEFIERHDLVWNIRDLPEPPVPTARLKEIVQELPGNDPHWWERTRADYLFSQFSDRHRAQAEAMIGGSEDTYATVFRRVRKGRSMAELRTDGIAGCLRTPRGGSGRQILFRGGRGRYDVRLLTARECARLQGVPDDYPINVGLTQALFGFGDAVCVPGIRWIADHYLSPVLTEMDAMVTESVDA